MSAADAPAAPPRGRTHVQVMLLCSKLIGAISRIGISGIAHRFGLELQPRLDSHDVTGTRQEILNLCDGMKAVELPVATAAQVGSLPLRPASNVIGRNRCASALDGMVLLRARQNGAGLGWVLSLRVWCLAPLPPMHSCGRRPSSCGRWTR